MIIKYSYNFTAIPGFYIEELKDKNLRVKIEPYEMMLFGDTAVDMLNFEFADTSGKKVTIGK